MVAIITAPWVTRFSIFWNERSKAAAALRMDQLEQTLKDYEADFADTKIFLARRIYNAGVAILTMVATIIAADGVLLWVHVLTDKTNGISLLTAYVGPPDSFARFLFGIPFAPFWYAIYIANRQTMRDFSIECTPDRYHRVMRAKIARLEKRIRFLSKM